MMDYKELAIKLFETWGWNTERYQIYGIPWYLKIYIYPSIWFIKKSVEDIIKRERETNE